MTTTGRASEQPEQTQTPTDSRPDSNPVGDRSASGVARIQSHQMITATSPADPAEVARVCAQLSRPQAVLGDWARFGFIVDEVATVWAGVDEAVRPAVEALQHTGVLDEQPPTDPMARALWLRQHRNTGPGGRQRAPKHLDTTARRRTR